MLGVLDLRDALRHWEAQDDAMMAARNFARATTYLSEHPRAEARTAILTKATELGIVMTEPTPFGGMNIARGNA
jgi:hypothetical protein